MLGQSHGCQCTTLQLLQHAQVRRQSAVQGKGPKHSVHARQPPAPAACPAHHELLARLPVHGILRGEGWRWWLLVGARYVRRFELCAGREGSCSCC